MMTLLAIAETLSCVRLQGGGLATKRSRRASAAPARAVQAPPHRAPRGGAHPRGLPPHAQRGRSSSRLRCAAPGAHSATLHLHTLRTLTASLPPLQRFLQAEGHRGEDVSFAGVPYRVHHFACGERDVWGLTAHVALQVAKALLQAEPEFQELAQGQPPHERMRAVSAL
jgi:hypothetical protein